jgi:hypothetical protein
VIKNDFRRLCKFLRNTKNKGCKLESCGSKGGMGYGGLIGGGTNDGRKTSDKGRSGRGRGLAVKKGFAIKERLAVKKGLAVEERLVVK